MNKKLLIALPLFAIALCGCGIQNTADALVTETAVWPGEVNAEGKPTTDIVVNWLGVSVPHYTGGTSYKYQRIVGDKQRSDYDKAVLINAYDAPATGVTDYKALLDATGSWYTYVDADNHLFSCNSNIVDVVSSAAVVMIEVVYVPVSLSASAYLSFAITSKVAYSSQVFPGEYDSSLGKKSYDIVGSWLGISVPHYAKGVMYFSQNLINKTSLIKTVSMNIYGLASPSGWSNINILDYIDFMNDDGSWVISKSSDVIPVYTCVKTRAGEAEEIVIEAKSTNGYGGKISLEIYLKDVI